MSGDKEMSIADQEPENLPVSEEVSILVDSSEETSDEQKPQDDNLSSYECFLQSLEPLGGTEARLRAAVDFMESSLSQEKTPDFKSFWEVRKFCLGLFKERLSPPVRAALWMKYQELSQEGYRLREILYEQSAFAVEQIGLAITALEQNVEKVAQEKLEDGQFSFSVECESLNDRFPFYSMIQYELGLLDVYASQINALRKELTKTTMRVREKNKFFQRLSAVGDHVFPKRKQRIKEVSKAFTDDIEAFVENVSTKEWGMGKLYFFRKEVQNLQALAKELTLNTRCFSHTRTKLSECWDVIKQLEKKQRQEREKQDVVLKENAQKLQQQIEEIAQQHQSGAYSDNELEKQLGFVATEMRKTELGRKEVVALKDALAKARRPIVEKAKAEAEKRREQKKAQKRAKEEKVQALKERLNSLQEGVSKLSADEVKAQCAELKLQVEEVSTSSTEKTELTRLLQTIEDLIEEKEEEALLSGEGNASQQLEDLKKVLQQRRQRRKEVKEGLRLLKANGTSDFAQAMIFNAQAEEEKERLKKINQAIADIEKKIASLEK